MKAFKQTITGLAALVMLAVAPSSFALPTLDYTTDNVGAISLDPFGGFDWNSAGSAVTTGFVADNTTVFTTEYWADAVAIQDPGGNNFTGIDLLSAGDLGGAEFTIQAFIDETAIGVALPPGETTAFFTAVGGSFNVWYDSTANAVLSTGSGITDGTLVLSGTILPGYAGSFTTDGTGGTGIFDFTAMITSTNDAFFNPDLLDTAAFSTIQFGTDVSGWTFPTSTPSLGGAAIPTDALVFQADANQAFGIPEPGMLALLSLGLFGLAGFKRRSSLS